MTNPSIFDVATAGPLKAKLRRPVDICPMSSWTHPVNTDRSRGRPRTPSTGTQWSDGNAIKLSNPRKFCWYGGRFLVVHRCSTFPFRRQLAPL